MARFFKAPIHYQGSRQAYSVEGTTRSPAPEVNDNDYRTSLTETTYVIQTHGATDTTNTRVDWVFVKGSGITNYTISVPTGKGSGDGIASRTIPSTVTAADGSVHNTTVNGIQHDLVNLGNQTIVTSNHQLRSSSVPVSNTLSSITEATTVTISLENAELSNIATDGSIIITGENPAGTTVTSNIFYPNHELQDKKVTTQAFITISSISVTGFRSGIMTVTANNSYLDCTEAQLVFTGTPRIYEIMLLEEVLYLHPERSFIDFNASYNDNSILRTNIRGESSRIRSLASRGKRIVTSRILFNDYSTTTEEKFLRMVDSNANFVFAQDENRYPDRIYPATWGQTNFGNRYYTRRISSGTTVDFVVQES